MRKVLNFIGAFIFTGMIIAMFTSQYGLNRNLNWESIDHHWKDGGMTDYALFIGILSTVYFSTVNIYFMAQKTKIKKTDHFRRNVSGKSIDGSM